MAKLDTNNLGNAALKKAIEEGTKKADAKAVEDIGIFSLSELIRRHGTEYNPTIIDGLIRQGEVMNLIAPPKVGKSWITYYIALSVVQGSKLFDRWATRGGRVAILDNELHVNTITARLRTTRLKMELPESVEDDIFIIPLRGKLKSIGVKRDENDKDYDDPLAMLMTWLASVEPTLVIIDSLYRILPAGISENDNAAIAQVMNRLDEYAMMLNGAGIILVHHTSKGSQAGKGITDVGSGAGSMGRAVDAHMILREHQRDDHYVLQAVTRTFKQPESLVICRDFPLWYATEWDPDNLKGAKGAKKPECQLDGPELLADYLPESGQVAKSALVKRIQERDGCTGPAAKDALGTVLKALKTDEIRKEDGEVNVGHGLMVEFSNNSPWLRREKVNAEARTKVD